jgi:hypothetical protein
MTFGFRSLALVLTLAQALAAGGSAMAQSDDNAHRGCTNRLLDQKAIEHGYHHQPTTAEIACRQAARGQSSLGAKTGRAIAELYEDAIRRSGLPERGVTLEERWSNIRAPSVRSF